MLYFIADGATLLLRFLNNKIDGYNTISKYFNSKRIVWNEVILRTIELSLACSQVREVKYLFYLSMFICNAFTSVRLVVSGFFLC